MEKVEIFKRVKHEGGLTLTHDLKDLTILRGYCVALKPYEKIVENFPSFSKGFDDLLEANKKLRNFIGLWYNPDNSLIYLDLVVILQNLNQALDLAKRNSQLAIYSLGTKKTITL